MDEPHEEDHPDCRSSRSTVRTVEGPQRDRRCESHVLVKHCPSNERFIPSQFEFIDDVFKCFNTESIQSPANLVCPEDQLFFKR